MAESYSHGKVNFYNAFPQTVENENFHFFKE